MYACIFFAPLLASIFLLRSRFFTRRIIHGVSFGLALIMFAVSLGGMIEMIYNQGFESIQIMTWIKTGSFVANYLLRFDSLTLLMTSIFSLALVFIHLHLIWETTSGCYSKNLLFYFPVLTIAVFLFLSANNFLQLYLGWELIGVISCLLLISSRGNVSRAMVIKMFAIDRLGNLALLFVLVAAYISYDTIIFDEIFYVISIAENVKLELFGSSLDALTVLNVLLIFAAITKCAQFSFQRWFIKESLINPALVTFIHLVSMGLAGVFILIRFSPMIERTPNILISLTIVGLLVSILSLVKALLCNDLGRTIVYLIFSYLGYIFVACGSSAYIGGVFHFLNIVIILALLLFSSGALSQCILSDINKGKQQECKNWPPIFYISASLGFLSLTGFPFLSAYYSEIIILEASLRQNNSIGTFVFYASLLVMGMTAFLGFKVLLFIWRSTNGNKKEVKTQINKFSWIFKVKLILLSFLALFAGTVGFNTVFGDMSSTFWGNVIPSPMRLETGSENIEKFTRFNAPLVISFFCGIVIAYFLYVLKPELRISFIEKCQILLARTHAENFYEKRYKILVSCAHLYSHNELYSVITDLLYQCRLHIKFKQIQILFSGTKHQFISYYGTAMLLGSIIFILYHCHSLKG
ncbi:MAG: hypothetical protein CMM43_04540 [Rhodospirillaceae bacterium]|nr:hypothetical protein [Rhodospirillaceae bacterium]